MSKKTRISTKRPTVQGGGSGGGTTGLVIIGPDWGDAGKPIQKGAAALVSQTTAYTGPTGAGAPSLVTQQTNFTGPTAPGAPKLASWQTNFTGPTGPGAPKIFHTLTVANSARSGTPDNDFTTDAWVDQANPNTNHGNDANLSMHAITVAGVSNDEQRAYIRHKMSTVGGALAWDTGHFNQAPFSLTVVIRNTSLALNNNVIVALKQGTFTESTLTWNNQPNTTTLVAWGTTNVPANTANTYVFDNATNSPSKQNDWTAGNDVYWEIVAGQATPTITMDSREGTTPPIFTAHLVST